MDKLAVGVIEDHIGWHLIIDSYCSGLHSLDVRYYLSLADAIDSGDTWHCVILDLYLPDTQGGDTPLLFRLHFPTVPAVIFSSAGIDELEQIKREHPDMAVLSKNLTGPDDLVDAVEQALNSHVDQTVSALNELKEVLAQIRDELDDGGGDE